MFQYIIKKMLKHIGKHKIILLFNAFNQIKLSTYFMGTVSILSTLEMMEIHNSQRYPCTLYLVTNVEVVNFSFPPVEISKSFFYL